MEGNLNQRLKALFSNPFFISLFLLFLIKVIGLIYSDDVATGLKFIEKKSTLIAIPFIILADPFANRDKYKKMMTAYCFVLLGVTLYCLLIAIWKYIQFQIIYTFFYHSLVEPILQSAVFFTVFVLAGLLYLLSTEISVENLRPDIKKRLQLFMIIYFTIFIFLLSSKLMLFILILILASFAMQKDYMNRNKKTIIITGLICIALTLLVLLTKNPIKERYLDMQNIGMIKKEKFSPGTYFNGVQLRLLQWKFAYQILNENNAWLIGVGPGDSQHLLNKKYADANMYMGNPERKDTGFLNYNFHNQYIEELVQSGIIGLVLLLFSCYILIRMAIRIRTIEAAFTVFMLLCLFVTESSLEMQDGLFLYSFLPSMLLSRYHQ